MPDIRILDGVNLVSHRYIPLSLARTSFISSIVLFKNLILFLYITGGAQLFGGFAKHILTSLDHKPPGANTHLTGSFDVNERIFIVI